MKRMRHCAEAIVLAGSLLLAASPAFAQNLLTQRRCADVTTSVSVFRQGGIPLLDWRENLEFDGRGTMWVSHVNNGQVEGYGPDGKLRTQIPVPAPGGIRRGIDGLMYVYSGVGNPLANDTGIMRFDPALPQPVATMVVGGISGGNGLAIDEDGNFYIGREFAPSVLKVRADGTVDAEWSAAADVFGTNGVAIGSRTLYANVIVDLASPVERVPLDNPGAHSTVANLSPLPLLYKALDDLEVVNGNLYAVSFVTGELLRVNPTSGAACLLAQGLRFPTSVRIPLGFGTYDPTRDVFVTEASGRIVRVTVNPR